MKRTQIIQTLTLTTASVFFVACGGGGSDATTTAGVRTSKITGTVPGTLIEAFCKDGSYAKVNSTQNGTNQHPFSISVPNNTECRLVMTTNENNASNRIITPIGFIKTGVNGQTLTLNADVDLGNIPLELDYNNVADGNNDHVVDSPLDVELNTSNATVSTTAISPYDQDNDNKIDVYQDNDNNGVVDAYDDDNNNGIDNIHEDQNKDNRPDYLEDDDKDGMLNYRDDNNNNGRPDYVDDDNNNGIENHIDNQNGNDDQNGNNNDDRNGNNNDDRNGNNNDDRNGNNNDDRNGNDNDDRR